MATIAMRRTKDTQVGSRETALASRNLGSARQVMSHSMAFATGCSERAWHLPPVALNEIQLPLICGARRRSTAAR